MKPAATQRGFSLLELMTAAAIFLILCGAAFGLLSVTQRSYQTESQVLSSFQEARLALDEIVRDVSVAGFPPSSQFSNFTTGTNHNWFAISPLAWSPGYTSGSSCTIGGSCTTPGDFDMIIESNIDLEQDRANGNEDVEWVRYQLPAGSTTLFRGVTQKNHWVDPDGATQATLVPLVQNVMNNATAAQIAQLQALYPSMFPGGAPVPIFRYLCDDLSALTRCDLSGSNAPANVREVEVTLIVQAPQLDPTTGNPRLVMLNGRGHRVNPKAP
jgi:prepilin-type N-terminal cleavage/methylation domain-containing protein